MLSDNDVFLAEDDLTTESIFRLPDDPLDGWLNLESSGDHIDDGFRNLYKQPPMLKTIELPCIGADDFPDYSKKGWLPQTSGLGLGLHFELSSGHKVSLSPEELFDSGQFWNISRNAVNLSYHHEKRVRAEEAGINNYSLESSPTNNRRKRKQVDG